MVNSLFAFNFCFALFCISFILIALIYHFEKLRPQNYFRSHSALCTIEISKGLAKLCSYLFAIFAARLRGNSFFIQCTEVRFASFLSGGFTTMALLNPLERNWQNAPLCSVQNRNNHKRSVTDLWLEVCGHIFFFRRDKKKAQLIMIKYEDWRGFIYDEIYKFQKDYADSLWLRLK